MGRRSLSSDTMECGGSPGEGNLSPYPPATKSPTGKGTKRSHDALAPVNAAPDTVESAQESINLGTGKRFSPGTATPVRGEPPKLVAGQPVHVFHRFQQNTAHLVLPVSSVAAGQVSPRIGTSDGWMPATVLQDWSPHPSPRADGAPHPPRVVVKYKQRVWFDRRGNMVDLDRHPDMQTEHVEIEQIETRERPPEPEITFVVVRWGGETTCDPVCEVS